MFKSIKHKLNNDKQNFSNIVREINGITDETLNPLNVNKEGVFGIEAHFSPLDHRYFNISPSHYTDVQGIETVMDYHMFKYSREHLHCYSVELMQPSFLPLKLEEYSLWDYLSQLANPQVEMFVQLLIYNENNDWRQLFTDQYIHYLMGNDYPLDNKLGRQLQTKILKGINKIAKFDLSRERNPHIEYKIKDNGYRFNMRIILHSKDNKQIKLMENEIQEILSTLDFYNQLVLVKEDDKEEFIYKYTNRIFTLSNQILSETELMSMFMSDVKYTPLEIKPIQLKSIGNKLELLPRSENTNKEIDEIIGERIIKAIKSFNINNKKRLFIVDQSRGTTLQKVTIKIPEGVKIKQFISNTDNFKAELGIDRLSIQQGNQPGTVSFLTPVKDKDIVYLRDMIESKEYKIFCENNIIPFCIGIDDEGNKVYECLFRLSHLLIAGASNSGKSKYLNQLILSLLLKFKPDELKMFLIDPKMVELNGFEGFPQVEKVETDMTEVENILNYLITEMEDRYKFLKSKGYNNMAEFNQDYPDQKKPYIILAIDEFADLIMVNKDVDDYVVRLGQKARAAGIHMIIATQRPDADIVTGKIKANIPSRICFSVSSGTDSRIVLDKNGAEELLGFGDGYAKLLGNKRELIRFQSPVITLNRKEEQNIYKYFIEEFSHKYGKKVDVIEENDDKTDENEENNVDYKGKLKRIILEYGEFRVAELQKLMNISINKVNNLMKELMDEGFLVKDGRSYRLSE